MPIIDGNEITDSQPPAGVQITVLQSVDTWLPQTMTWLYVQTSLLPTQIESHILCDATDNLEQFGMNHIHAFNDRPLRRFLARHSWSLYAKWRARERVRVARSVNLDILHSHFGDRGWGDLGLAQDADAKHVVTFYGYDVNRLPQVDSRWRVRYQELFRSIKLVLCEGPHLARCIEALGCPTEKVRVHHLGVTVGKIAFRPKPWRRGQRLRVLIAGTFVEKKGIPCALEALARLRASVELDVTIIGDAIDQDRSRTEKRHILETIDRLDLGSSVSHRGFRPYAELLAAAYDHHIFLSPSITASDGDTEGGAPVTIIEMAASGMQIVSTRHCDIPEVVLDRITGFLADEGDSDGVYRALLEVTDDPESWQVRAIAGRRHVERNFNAATQSQRLAAIYASVANPRMHSASP